MELLLLSDIQIYSISDDDSDNTNSDNINSDDTNSDDSISSSTALIYGIIFGLIGLIIILIALFFILRYFKKKKQNVDYVRETRGLNNENLLMKEY